MGIVSVGNVDELTSPLVLREILLNPGLSIRAILNTDNGYKFVKWKGVWRQRCWGRVLQQEFFHSLSEILHAELNLGLFVSWSNENSMSFWIDVVASSERSSYSLNGLLHVSGEVPLVYQEVVVFGKTLESTFLVDVLDGLVGAILSNILTWELESIAVCGLKRNGVVSEIKHWESKLFEVSHESGEDVSLWHVDWTIFVELYKRLV